MSERLRTTSSTSQFEMAARIVMAAALGLTACTDTKASDPNSANSTHQASNTNRAEITGKLPECKEGLPRLTFETSPELGNIRAYYEEMCAAEVRDPNRPDSDQIPLGPGHKFVVVCFGRNDELVIQRETIDRKPVGAKIGPNSLEELEQFAADTPNHATIPNCTFPIGQPGLTPSAQGSR